MPEQEKIVPIVRWVRKPKKDISREPEMQELKRMIWEGELDMEKTKNHLEGNTDNIQSEIKRGE